MGHDWEKAPEQEWRGFVSDKLEGLEALLSKHCEKDTGLEKRLITVEVKSGLIATMITVIGGTIAWFFSHKG